MASLGMHTVLAAVFVGVVSPTLAWGDEPVARLKAAHAPVLARWLQKHPGYRLATETDCKCHEDLVRMRTHSDGQSRALPNYHPYYAEGDFNWDGTGDFAVGVVKGPTPTEFQVLMFNDPFGSKHSARAAFVSDPLPLGQALFFGDPRPKPQMLVVGSFETEGAALRPTKKGYVWEYPED